VLDGSILSKEGSDAWESSEPSKGSVKSEFRLGESLGGFQNESIWTMNCGRRVAECCPLVMHCCYQSPSLLELLLTKAT
jgi:hypothetical protein